VNKKKKNKKLSKNERLYNKGIAKSRITNEHVIGTLKKFKILSTPYRNRRSRFSCRFQIIARLCNLSISL
jgi:DDE superfamily endonuclease